MHLVGQFCLFAAVQSNAIQSIVLTSQAFDNLLLEWAKETCGLAVSGGAGWLCVAEKNFGDSSPFDPVTLFTYGFIVRYSDYVVISLFGRLR